ncbi:helix-turn-helix domain-containing protein [Dyadobacter sp. BHUBP1]|uniref:helix-turn-helix domain-containing protein n=1 Tax=Dyadobacter sp. BHUBP1 TaxID=3424178 RepID=UPI003D33E681
MAKQEIRTRVEVNAINEYQLITVGDLERFRIGLLEEIKMIVSGPKTQAQKKWIKTSEVRRVFDISLSKLHALRASRQLAYMRIGGVIYYDIADIEKMFDKFKTPVK